MSERLRRAIGALLLLFALVIGFALRAVEPSAASDLRPRPDAFEYEEAARNLAEGQGYGLIIDGAKYPPRYPPGLSLLIALVLQLGDAGFGTGVLAVLACALLAIVGVFVLGTLAAGPIAGGVAALFLAASPEDVIWSQMVMSDVPSSCAVTWVLVATTLAARKGHALSWFGLGIAVGLTTLLRLMNLAVALPVALCAALSAPRASRASVLVPLSSLGVGIALGLVPILGYQLSSIGSPLQTGYHLWAPEQFFGLRYLTAPPAAAGTEPNPLVYAEAVIGLDRLYPWPIALLLLLGLVDGLRAGGRRRELGLLATANLVAFFLGYAAYFWQGVRFLLPALPALLAVAGSALAPEASRRVQGVAFTLTVLGLVSLAGSGEMRAPDRSFEERQVLAVIAEHTPPDAAILVRTNEAYFRRLLRARGEDRIWVQIGADPHEAAIRKHAIAPYAEGPRSTWIRRGLRPRNAVAIVSQLLDEGRPVYLSTQLAYQVAMFKRVFVTLRNAYRFELVGPTSDKTDLFRLVPREPHGASGGTR